MTIIRKAPLTDEEREERTYALLFQAANDHIARYELRDQSSVDDKFQQLVEEAYQEAAETAG